MSQLIELRAVIEEATESSMTARLVPFGEKVPYGDGTVSFAQGSIRVDGKIPLTIDHGASVSDRIGVMTRHFETDAGMFAEFKISDTPKGQEIRTLLADGALSDVSVGVQVDTAEHGRDSAMQGVLDHVSVVVHGRFGKSENPSKVLAVHEEKEPTVAEVEMETVAPVAVFDDTDLKSEIAELKTELVAQAERLDESTRVEAKTRGYGYSGIGELLGDVVSHARRKSPDATQRLEMAIDDGVVEADGSGINLFAFPNPADVGNSVGSSTPNNVYVPDLLTLLRAGRPVADLFGSRSLPATGNTIQLPKVTVGNTVGYQDGEGTAVEATRQDWILNDFSKATIAGGQGVTLQASQWSDPSYSAEVVSDLISAYSEFIDNQTINGDPAVDTPASGTGFLGILNAGATDVPVSGDVKASLAFYGAAWAAVYAGSKRSPIAAIMSGAVWGAYLDEVDTDGRPIVTTDFPANPAGVGSPAQIAGTIRSIPVVLDDNMTDTDVIVGSFRDALLYEDSATPVRIALTYPDVLVTDISVYGFSSLAIRRPGSFAVLSGITGV